MKRYSCWTAYSEPLPISSLDYPDRVVSANNEREAAEMFADNEDLCDDGIAVIVRDDETGKFFEIEMHKEWEMDMYKPTTQSEAFKS